MPCPKAPPPLYDKRMTEEEETYKVLVQENMVQDSVSRKDETIIGKAK